MVVLFGPTLHVVEVDEPPGMNDEVALGSRLLNIGRYRVTKVASREWRGQQFPYFEARERVGELNSGEEPLVMEPVAPC